MTTVGLSQVAGQAAREPLGAGLTFLWLELTNRCNLKCVHCYTESGPQTGDRDLLTTDDYLSVMNQAYALGCGLAAGNQRGELRRPAAELGRDAHDRGGGVGEDLELACALIQRLSGILSATQACARQPPPIDIQRVGLS